MHSILPKSILFIIIALFFLHWTERKNDEGITIFTRKNSESRIDEFKGVTIVSARLSSVVALIENVSVAPKWIHYCKSSKVLQKISATESITYTETSLPWPLNNRETVVKNSRVQDKSTKIVTIRFEASPDSLPESSSFVRITNLKGSWILKPVDEGVEVTYQVLSDPGGNLPSWMVNSGIVDQPFKTLQNMKKILQEPRFIEAQADGIQD